MNIITEIRIRAAVIFTVSSTKLQLGQPLQLPDVWGVHPIGGAVLCNIQHDAFGYRTE